MSNIAKSATSEKLKWGAVLVLIVAGIVANYYYAGVSLPIRLAVWLLVAALAGGIAATTVKGRQAIVFTRDAQNELRKVTWPTRQETVQTTLIVVVIVAIASVILWLLDSLLLWAVSFIT